jgi:hypothetical protein
VRGEDFDSDVSYLMRIFIATEKEDEQAALGGLEIHCTHRQSHTVEELAQPSCVDGLQIAAAIGEH